MLSPWRSCIFAKSQTLDTKNLFDASAACPKVKSPQVFRLRKKAPEERSEIQQLVYDGVVYTILYVQYVVPIMYYIYALGKAHRTL